MNAHSVLSCGHDSGQKSCCFGRGTMGAQIAAHLANAGIPTLLLDIVPKGDAETRPSGRVQEPDRNAIARAGFEAAKKAKPAAFFTAERASLVSIGNFEDDLPKLKDCDLIIEAVVENLDIKRSLYEKARATSQASLGHRLEHQRHSSAAACRRPLGRLPCSLSGYALLQPAALHASG
jgi:3-hydroxyacyl-CoA dehydrogenase